MGKLSTAIAFLTGAAVGGAAVWYITKEWYARLTEEEINSVKEAYALYGHKQEKYLNRLDCQKRRGFLYVLPFDFHFFHHPLENTPFQKLLLS